MNKFEIVKLRDFEYPEACYQFQFNKKNSDELLFVTKDEIFLYDYLDESKDKEEFYRFDSPLINIPQFVNFSPDQKKCIVASDTEAMFVCVENQIEVNLDEMEELESIKNSTCDGKFFYLMANKKEQKLGYYILRINVDKPGEIDYLMQWDNRLDIGNVNLGIFNEKGT